VRNLGLLRRFLISHLLEVDNIFNVLVSTQVGLEPDNSIGTKKGKLHFPPRVKCKKSKTISRILNVYKRLITNKFNCILI
jgi:hypothetical protein